MDTNILAHGGRITGDEMVIIGGGLFFAMAFPVVALLIALRRSKRRVAELERGAPAADHWS